MRRLAVVALLFGCLVLIGCGEKPTQVTPGATPQVTSQGKAAAVAACASNRVQLDAQYAIVQSGASSEGDTTFEGMLQRLGIACPSGGTYSWDTASGASRCSAHPQ